MIPPIRPLWLLLIGVVLLCAGCASSSPEASGEEEISQLPWSRPQSWEGQGMLGGMVPPQR